MVGSSHRQRRRPLSATLLAASLALTACGGAGGDGGATPTEPARAANQDLRVAVGEDPFFGGANPPNNNLGLLAGGPNPGIFETLTRLTPTYGIGPGLAQGWEAPTPTNWRFTLRPGVRFHNGAPLDAAAVVAFFDGLGNTRLRGLERGGSTAAGDLVVEVTLTLPNSRLAEQLANPSLGVRAPGTAAGPGDDPARTPTGTGPFRFVSYSRGAQLRVEPFAEYWGDQALLRSLTFRFGAERDASRLLATRQVELVGQIPYGSIANVSGRTDRLVTSRPGRSLYLLLNIGGVDEWATLKDENLRRAVALALDRTTLTKSAFGELAEPSRTLVLEPALGPSAERVRAPGADERAAARLLEDAGWRRATDGVRTRDGQPLVLRLILSQPAEQAEVGALIRAQLAQVGVGVEIVDPAPDTPFVRINQSTFHLYLDVRAQDDANPCNLCRFFTIRPGGSLPFAGSVGAGQDGDNLFELLHSTGPIDGARRLAADLMNIVTTERILAIPLAGLRSAWVVSPRVRGFDPAPLGGDQRWDAVWLAA